MLKPRWTKEQEDYLKENFERMYLRQILELPLFSGKTLKALKWKANRLGLRRDRKAEKNPNWKGGRWSHLGYIVLTCKFDCPYADKRGRVKEQYYVWWKYYPDDLILVNEVLHHINENKTDNRIENLKKMSRGEHKSLHNKGNKYGLHNKGKKYSRKEE